MSLLAETIWWHVYPLGACGAPIFNRSDNDHAHRLTKLTNWLDYLGDLGCNGLLLGPIFESSAHGYDTIDHFSIDRRLGDIADWNELVQQCSKRNIPIILDGVFNHVGINHQLVSQGELIKTSNGHPYHWEGMADLVELDHSNPKVADLVSEIMCYWLAAGATGWRLDVAYAVPTSFWHKVLKRVRHHFPTAIFIGEIIHGDYVKFATESSIDSITQYELWKAIWSSISDENMWELAHALERHSQFTKYLIPQIFIGNHDVTRIASAVGIHGAVIAAAILFSLPGSPSIYYADEQGIVGEKGEGLMADLPLRGSLPEIPLPDQPITKIYRQLIYLRRSNSWISSGRLTVLDKTNETIHYQVSNGNNILDALINLKPASATLTINNHIALELSLP